MFNQHNRLRQTHPPGMVVVGDEVALREIWTLVTWLKSMPAASAIAITKPLMDANTIGCGCIR